VIVRLEDFNRDENLLDSPFRVRQGVHTGRTLIDWKRGVAYSPNLDVAGHLQKDAETDGLLISQQTLEALPDGLPFERKGQLAREGIPTYRLVARIP
jgi:class 3 adenylate cyclase